jgi:hypothetical protein
MPLRKVASAKSDPSQRFLRLGDRLAAASRRRLWGRERELAVFRSALTGSLAPFSVLYLYGLGGVGKSALLAECASEAARADVQTVRLDGRNIEASPGGFLHAFGDALGLDEPESALDRMNREAAVVVTIDSYDWLTPLDPWLRETFLPQLPARGVVAIAGRHAPSMDWTSDPSFGPIFRPIALRNLEAGDSRALLSERGVPEHQHAAVLRFTHGHPLALVLVADVIANAGDDSGFNPESTPNVVHELLVRLIATVPTAAHRKALETCARARVTTEALLGAVIEDGDPHELFEWLRGLSCIEHGAEGLFPHDLARDVLDADFRWRDPDGFFELHRRVWRTVRQKVVTTSGRARQRAFFDKLYLHRASPTGGQFHDYASLGTVYAQAATERDHAAIADTVRRHEGNESARIAAYWLDRQPHAFAVARGASDEMLGFVTSLALREESTEACEVDPATRAAWSFARRSGRLREGDQMVHHRFHISCDRYQEMSPIFNLLSMRATFAAIEDTRLAWSLVAFSDPARWVPMMQYVNFERADAAAFTVGGRLYGVYAHDWRAEPWELWWDQLGERSLSFEPVIGEEASIHQSAPVVVLSEPEFTACVRQALRDWTRPAALAGNPLLQSRLVVDGASDGSGVPRLQALLREALDTLNQSPRDEKFHRALLYTYFQLAATQEGAAERLGLPFSTYRYHLARGTDRIIEWLWGLELTGVR